MKILFLLFNVFALIFFTSSCASNNNCIRKIRKGTFTTNQEGIDNRIIRTKNEQVEYFNGGNSRLVSSIDWVKSDEYILTIEECVNCPDPNDSLIGLMMSFQIVECDTNSFTVRTDIDEVDVFIEYQIVR